MHAVDKVHVGPSRRPIHHLVPLGPPEPGVRRQVPLPDVRLDLDDSSGAPPVDVVSDEAPAEERGADGERREGEQALAIEWSRQLGRTVT